jgi:hypothetical protein
MFLAFQGSETVSGGKTDSLSAQRLVQTFDPVLTSKKSCWCSNSDSLWEGHGQSVSALFSHVFNTTVSFLNDGQSMGGPRTVRESR